MPPTLSPEEALALYPETAVILLLSPPDNLSMGLNNLAFDTGPRFRGFKLVPPGAHYLHYTLGEEKHMFRTGFFVHVKEGTRLVFEWSQEVGTWVEVDEKEKRARYVEAVDNFELDPYLGPFDMSSKALWKESTLFVTPTLIDKLVPRKQMIGNTLIEARREEIQRELLEKQTEEIAGEGLESQMDAEDEYIQDMEKKQKQARKNSQEDQQKEFNKPSNKTPKIEPFAHIIHSIEFTMIPKRPIDTHKKLAELTAAAMDYSEFLEKIIEKEYKGYPERALGELQVSFILFLIGENLDAFEQYKKLLNLLCRSDNYLFGHREFTNDLLRVLTTQLKQFPEQFFLDILLPDKNDNLIVQALSQLSQVETFTNRWKYVDREMVRLCGPDWNEEDEEFKPVVVDLDQKLINFNE